MAATTRRSSLSDTGLQIKYPYLVAAVGVAMIAITTAYGAVRSMLIRETFRGGFNGTRQFGNVNSFGLTSGLTILAVTVAIVGLAWLGLVLRKSGKSSSN